MTGIIDKTAYIKKDAFTSFEEKRAKYASVNKQGEKTKEAEGDILEIYEKEVKNPHSNAFRYTVAGGIALVLGGLGLFVGRKNIVKFSEYLRNLGGDLAERANLPGAGALVKMKKAAVNGTKNVVDTYYVVDKFKDTGLMLALRNIDKGFAQIGLSKFKPGEAIINFSKWSLSFTRGTLARTYSGARKNVESAGSTLLEGFSKTSSSEQTALRRAKRFIEGGNLNKQLGKVQEKAGERIRKLDEEIEKKVTDVYLDKYFPKLNKLFSPAEWRRIGSNWRTAFKEGKQDVLRENWDDVEQGLRKKVTDSSVNGKSLNNSMDEFDKIIDDLNKFVKSKGGKEKLSKEFNTIYDSLTSARSKVESAVNFEVSSGVKAGSYSGRAIDLGAGGGIPETLIPIVTAGVIAGNALKHSEEHESAKDITKKFMASGGFEFIGSLGAWVVTAVMMGISGSSAVIASLGTALGLNLIKKSYNKMNDKKQEEPKDTKVIKKA